MLTLERLKLVKEMITELFTRLYLFQETLYDNCNRFN